MLIVLGCEGTVPNQGGTWVREKAAGSGLSGLEREISPLLSVTVQPSLSPFLTSVSSSENEVMSKLVFPNSKYFLVLGIEYKCVFP